MTDRKPVTDRTPTVEPPAESTVERPGGRGLSADFLTELFRNPLDPGYAEAARRRSEAGSPPGAWRTGAGRGSRVLVLALIGFLLTVAYQDVLAAQPATDSARDRLSTDVRNRRAQTDELQRRADGLRDDVARARDEALAGGAEASQLRGLEATTGLVAVRGDGIVVRIADAPPQVDPVTGKQTVNNRGLVIDRDLQEVANELWRAGAEAIAINDQRLTATSTIRAAGSAILVDFRPVSSPYLLAAIGPSDLDKRFGDSPTAKRFHRYVDAYRMQFSTSKQQLKLPAAPDPQLRHARPPATAPASPVRSASGGVR